MEISPRPALIEPLIDLARKRFFYDFVFAGDPKNYRASHLEFIPDMLERAHVDSCLAESVDAIALANFSKRRNSPELNAMAMKVYGRAMNSVNAAIADPDL